MPREFAVILCTCSIAGGHGDIHDSYNMETYSQENTLKYKKRKY